jgi:HK97 family phage major capsid protein
MNKLMELKTKLAVARENYQRWLASVSDPSGTADYQATVDRHEETIARLSAQVEHEQRKEAVEMGGQTRVTPGRTGEERRLEASDHGWQSFGEFAGAIIAAADPYRPQLDERLTTTGFRADAPGSTISTGADGQSGGFLVPPSFSERLRELALEQDSLLPFCSVDEIAGNALDFPVDESTPWGSSGVRAAWEGEGQLLTKTAPDLESRGMKLKKLTCLVPVTNEMVEDSAVLNTWLPRNMGRAIAWKTNSAIVAGGGAGIPLGFANAVNGSLITQTKETSQTADTIVAANIAKMFGRCSGARTAVFILHPDAWNQIPLMTIGDQPVWIPPSQGMQLAPNGLLFGRPIILSDACQTLGDAGDIYLADLQQYQVVQKAGGVSFATSMHVWFDYDMTAFRATFRMDGMPVTRNPITPPNSSITRSAFVQLEART